MLYLIPCSNKVIRFSVPFTPPVKDYRSLEDVVKKAPNYAYQLYFANPESTNEVNANVRKRTFEAVCTR